jgi:uncharacterized membrane protein
MKIRNFLNKVDHERIDRAIQMAEHKTGGRVVVYIDHRRVEDGLAESHRLFQKLRLETERNKVGLLLFVAPKSQKFSVVGGTALHGKLGQPWWDHLAKTMERYFRENRYTDGLLAAIEEAGRMLHLHFPSEDHAATRPEIIEK